MSGAVKSGVLRRSNSIVSRWGAVLLESERVSRERERERERTFKYLSLANTSIVYSTICLYAVAGCQKGQSPSKLATHCSKQHNNKKLHSNKKVVQ